MHPSWSEVERGHTLALVLTERLLVESVCDLKTVAGREDVEVERVLRRHRIVEAVEDVHRTSLVVQRLELGSVEEAVRAVVVERRKVAELCVAKRETTLLLVSPKRAECR